MRGDEYDLWGTSTGYFEIVLTYDTAHLHDEFGALGDQPIDLPELLPFEIDQDVFETAWQGARAVNR